MADHATTCPALEGGACACDVRFVGRSPLAAIAELLGDAALRWQAAQPTPVPSAKAKPRRKRAG